MSIPMTMKRVVKGAGRGNIQIEEVPSPHLREGELLIRTHRSLISAGSELGSRYLVDGPVDPRRMGYLVAGEVVKVGSGVTQFAPGDRVSASGPHAELSVAAAESAIKLPHSVSFEAGTFVGLTCSALRWIRTAQVRSEDAVVILGQGIVGSLILQALVNNTRPKRVIAVDGHKLRCERAVRLGADEVINFRDCDVAQAVHALNGSTGIDVVFDAVGGSAGAQSFEMAQTLLNQFGRLVLVGLNQDHSLTLTPHFLMTRKILGANSEMGSWVPKDREDALELVASGAIGAREMITHRLPFERAKEGFDLLHYRPEEALCVVLMWPPSLNADTDVWRNQ